MKISARSKGEALTVAVWLKLASPTQGMMNEETSLL
jgi:hypothetical protein